MKRSIVISLFLILGLLVGASFADQKTLFGQQYLRTKGKPNEYDDSFGIRGPTSAARLSLLTGLQAARTEQAVPSFILTGSKSSARMISTSGSIN